MFITPRFNQFRSRVAQSVRQNSNDFDGHLGKLPEKSQEMVLADAQCLELAGCLHGRRARDVAQDCNLADDGIRFEFSDLDLAGVRLDQNVGGAREDDVCGVAFVALMEQDLAWRCNSPDRT